MAESLNLISRCIVCVVVLALFVPFAAAQNIVASYPKNVSTVVCDYKTTSSVKEFNVDGRILIKLPDKLRIETRRKKSHERGLYIGYRNTDTYSNISRSIVSRTIYRPGTQNRSHVGYWGEFIPKALPIPPKWKKKVIRDEKIGEIEYKVFAVGLKVYYQDPSSGLVDKILHYQDPNGGYGPGESISRTLGRIHRRLKNFWHLKGRVVLSNSSVAEELHIIHTNNPPEKAKLLQKIYGKKVSGPRQTIFENCLVNDPLDDSLFLVTFSKGTKVKEEIISTDKPPKPLFDPFPQKFQKKVDCILKESKTNRDFELCN